MRKILQLTSGVCDKYGSSLWRQSKHNIKQIKRSLFTVQNKKRSRGRTEEQKRRCEAIIKEAHTEYIKLSQWYLNKAYSTLEMLEKSGISSKMDELTIGKIRVFMNDANRQIEQINRRVLQGEKIAHEEKTFSIFQRHTEWVNKGKAGVPVELGLKVCVMESQYQFIMFHEVMEKKTDDQVAVSMVRETRKRFHEVDAISFDKGFHSPENQAILKQELKLVALPRKGKLSQQAQEIERSEELREARRKHSAVESGINALEVHGLDRCRDHGIDGFKRYVALAIVARNIQRIGAILQKREQKRIEKRKKKYNSANNMYKVAA
jgi:transposase, IS5 family